MLHSSVALAMGATFILPSVSAYAAEKENKNVEVIPNTDSSFNIQGDKLEMNTDITSEPV